MQKPVKLISVFKILFQVFIIIGIIFLTLHFTTEARAETPGNDVKKSAQLSLDSTIAKLIKAKLLSRDNEFYYPLSVRRFYESNGFKFAFIAPETAKTHAWDAMLFLDCVIQYGLNPADYHPDLLTYEHLHALVAQSAAADLDKKVAFDLLLTDAMITLINNLHFGKFNPNHTSISRDGGNIRGFAAEEVLAKAIEQPSLIAAIEHVQPASEAYANLHTQMRLVTGVYILDCYETPPKDIKLMAINMERLRWAGVSTDLYLEINIPAYSLRFHTPKQVYTFKVIAGKPASPTASLKSVCNEIITAPPKTAVPRMMLPLANGSVIYLANDSETYLFYSDERDLSDGHIVVENGKKFVDLLLANDGMGVNFREALKAGRESTIALIKALPVNIVYLTCAAEGGSLITYKDIYHLDQQLELKLYPAPNEITSRLREKR